MFYFKRKSGPRSRAIFTKISWTLAFDARSANRWHSAARTSHSIADIILANGRFPEDAESVQSIMQDAFNVGVSN